MQEYSTPKAMKRVGDLFEKYRVRLRPPQASVEKECIQVIKEVTGFDITAGQISYRVSTKTISLHVPSILKSELCFYHQAILRELANRLGKDNCPTLIL